MNKIIKLSFITIASCLLLGAQVGVQSVIMAGVSGSPPLNPCTVEAYPMNEGSGSTFFDLGPSANNATVTSGSITWSTIAGFPGSVATGTYNTTAGSATPTTNLFTGNASFTVAFWTNATSQGSPQVWFDTSAALTAPGIYIRDGGSGDHAFEVGLTSVSQPTGLAFVQSSWQPDGTLQYLAWVYTASGAPAASHFVAYKNGVATGQSVLTNNLSSTVTSTHAAVQSTGPGTVAYFQIFNCALSTGQLATNYAAGPQLN